MAKLRHRLPWPAEVADHYYNLVKVAGIIFQLLTLCHHEGIRVENYGVIGALLSKISVRNNGMRDIAKRIIKQSPKRPKGGARPKWCQITLDIIAISLTLDDLIEITKEEFKIENHLVVDYLILRSLDHIKRVVDMLELLPVEVDPLPESIQDFIEELNNDNL